MVGIGPAPKPKHRRARRNKDVIPTTVLRFERGEQPKLPPGVRWPQRTLQWWRMWAQSPQAEHFTITDWDFLLDTALIHALFWEGNLSLAPELRIRVAKFGATPEDRARLRMQFAEADEADARRPAEQLTGSKQRYAELKVLPGGSSSAVARPDVSG